jgi:hypothetical protein
MGYESIDTDDGRSSASRRDAFTWGNFVALGLILYELTGQPAIGVAGVCVKFGWADLRSACWLLRSDPFRGRGWACSWMYVGWGLFKATAMGCFIGMFSCGAEYIFAGALNAAGRDRLRSAAIGGGNTMLLGCCLSGIATLLSVLIACLLRQKVWLHESVNVALRRRIWPPYSLVNPPKLSLTHGGASFIPFRQMLLSTVPAAFILSCVSFCPVRPVWLACIITFGLSLLAMAWMAAMHFASADVPEQCWPPDELAAESADPLQ